MTLYEEYALRRGFLQSLDPRIKTAAVLMFIVTAVYLKSAFLIGWLYGLCLVLAVCSRIPIGFFLKRTWIFIPLFSLFIVLPALFSFVTPGEPVASFGVLGIEFVITRPGVDGAVLFVTRTAVSVSLAVLLSLTTRHGELLKVLRVFGVPQIFVMTISMCYRYLYLFAVMIENIFTSVKSRVGVVSNRRKGQSIVAWNIANTWNRANRLNEDVYRAMISRGYNGEPRLSDDFRADTKDWLWMVCALAICTGLFFQGFQT